MEKKNHSEEISALKAHLEEMIGTKITTPKEFDRLGGFIQARTSEYISSTTLKRIWGYIDEPLQTRSTTLNILAKAVGYKSWEDFLSRNEGQTSESKISSSPSFGSSINVMEDLEPGETIMLYWNPGRECLVKYLGGLSFEVVESKKTRLQPGDTFDCHLILSGHPLYLSKLVQNDQPPIAYICGKIHGGIQFKRFNE